MSLLLLLGGKKRLSTGPAIASAYGSSSAIAIGALTAFSAFSAVGSCIAEAVGFAVSAGTGAYSAEGTSTVSGVGASSFYATATSSGVAVVEAVGSGSSGSSVDYDFTSATLPSGVTLTRASSGTRYNNAGVLESVGVDTARFDYNPSTLVLRGLLVEPQKTNYAFNSSAYVAAYNGAITTGQSDPSGGANAYLVTENTTYNSHYSRNSNNIAYATGTTYTISNYIKAGEEYIVAVGRPVLSNPFPSGVWASFNLTTGAVAYTAADATSSIQAATGSFYRCAIRGTTTSAQTASYNCLDSFTNNSSASNAFVIAYAGTSKSYTRCFSQVEDGNLTSYIPTTTAAATRSADVVQFTIPSGVTTLRFTFDDNTTQDVAVSAGAYTVPTNLNRAWVKRIQSV